MGCNCWNKKNRVPPPQPPKGQPAPPGHPIAKEVTLPPQPKVGGVAQSKFCNKCGWMIKKVQYSDPRSGITVEKFICTNQDCKNYST